MGESRDGSEAWLSTSIPAPTPHPYLPLPGGKGQYLTGVLKQGEESIMRKSDQQSRPSAALRKFLGFATGLLIFLLLVILGQLLSLL